MTGTSLQIIRMMTEEDPKKLWDVKEHKEKRTLNQNSLYWLYVGKIAKKTRINAARIHNENLRALCQPERIGGNIVTLYIPDTDDAEEAVLNSSTYHLRPTSETREGKDGVTYRGYILLRGSHTFDVATMSALLDMVIEEAKAQDIETISPQELERLREYERNRDAKYRR